MRDFSHLPDVQMAAAITTLAGRLAAGEAEQLGLIGEFDARQAWAGPGLLSCAPERRPRTGPHRPFAAGVAADHRGVRGVSFSQVRALTRVADAGHEADLVELARNTRGMRRVHKIEQDAADPELAEFGMRTTGYEADGNFVLRLVCSAQDGALVQAALEQVQAELDRQRATEATEASEAAAAEPAAALEPADVSAKRPGRLRRR
ncbi:MAG: hypothetical protein KY451_12215 [Actinobacteria bacterium]|nr:hypothetical protein [Actinomycetota bacterium]